MTACYSAFLWVGITNKKMANLYVKEIGLLNIKESKDEVLIELKNENPEWAQYTVVENFYGEMSGKTHTNEKLLTIRTRNIIAVE